MKGLMMKYLMINCREATMLMAKKEERQVSFFDKMKLSLHISLCSLCKRFEKQTLKIAKESRQVQADEKMSVYGKEKIERIIDGFSS